MPNAQIEDTLRSMTGVRVGPYTAFNDVSRVQIWQWCTAMSDNNPLYLDESYQAAHGINGPVAPPAMMQMWTMRNVHNEYAPGSTVDRPFPVIDYLARNGYPGNVAVSYDITFHRLLVEGDRATMYKTVDSISDLKQTALGEGYFFTDRVEYLDQHDELFAVALITYFQYLPREQDNAAEAPAPGEPPVASGDWRSDHGDLAIGDLAQDQALPELAIPITHKLIVSGAAASQDYVDGHHNLPAAQAQAMPDIFMNILTTCGLTGRYLTDWGGAGSRLQRLSFKLMAPNVPGDTMVMQGRVSALHPEQSLVDVEFAGRNSRGFHLTGAATLSLAG